MVSQAHRSEVLLSSCYRPNMLGNSTEVMPSIYGTVLLMILLGAIYTTGDAVLSVYGSTSFIGNTGVFAGAIFAGESSQVNLYGATFVNNTAAVAGAILLSYASLNIERGVFTGNSAGTAGAIDAVGSSVSISGGATFSHNTASVSGGGLYLNWCENVTITEGVSFIGNVASIDGGAIYLNNPAHLTIQSSTFVLNTAGFGGAVAIVATDGSEEDNYLFRWCTLEENSATDGGALYLFLSLRNAFVDGCVFRGNNAVASGGAVYSTGTIFANGTRFVGNKAGVQGMAVVSYGIFVNSAHNVSFEANARYCPLGQYSYDEDLETVDGTDTCRAEVVCTRCTDGCDDVFPGFSFPSNSTAPAALCENLPVGTVASSTGTTLATLQLDEGYYRTSDESHVVLECYQKDSCIGGVDASNYCAVGYKGPYCAVCAEYYRPSFAYGCHKCSGRSLGSAAALVIATLVVFLAVLAVTLSELVAVVQVDDGTEEEQYRAQGFWMQRLSSCRKFLVEIFPLTSVKIVVVVWQILTQFAAIAGAVYPDEYQRFLSNLNPINLDIGAILSYSCIADTNFYDRLLLTTIMPLVVFAVLGATYSIAKKRSDKSEHAIRVVQHRHLSAALFVMFFVYSSVSFTVFQTFICDPLDDGVDYLRADYRLSCSSDEYARYVTYAGVMVFVYPIGIPAAFAWWLVRNRHDLRKSGRETMARLQPVSGLWVAYRPSRFYYEVVECGRRIALTGVAAFVLPGSAAQIAVVLLLAVVFSFISESMRPFKEKIEMRLYRWGNGVVLASMYVALLRKVDVSGDDTPAQSAFAGVLIAGNVFMIVAVLVQSALFVKEWRAGSKVVEVDDPSRRSILRSSVTCMQVVRDADEVEIGAVNERAKTT